mgnify:CR=1 FL=1
MEFHFSAPMHHSREHLVQVHRALHEFAPAGIRQHLPAGVGSLAGGLLDLYEASGEARWLVEARALVEAMHARLWDERGGGYRDNNNWRDNRDWEEERLEQEEEEAEELEQELEEIEDEIEVKSEKKMLPYLPSISLDG